VIIQNSPASGFGSEGSWNVWSQPNGEAWYFSTKVDLVHSDLCKELDTNYFDNNPAKKMAIIEQLTNYRSAFSLKQLLFDLDSAVLQSVPTIEGLEPTSSASTALTRSFVELYSACAKQYGMPLISVHMIADHPDGSSLPITGMERQVSQYKDKEGMVVEDPVSSQKQVFTLDYLCAANNNPLPSPSAFSWNWVESDEVADKSGMIAVNRNTLAKYFENNILSDLMKSCIKVSAHADCAADAWISGNCSYGVTYTTNQTPQYCYIPDSGTEVLKVHYQNYSEAHDQNGATYCQTQAWSCFDSTLSFINDSNYCPFIILEQHLSITVSVKWDSTYEETRIFDRKITNKYSISVNISGSLQLTKQGSQIEDNSQKPNADWLTDLFTGVNDAINSLESQSADFLTAELTSVPLTDLQSFVFPGGNVFTYTKVKFSDNQDLVADITYLTPSDLTPSA
jgi:hypothetical protein